MAERGASPRISLEDVLEIFRERADPTEPLTAPEIAKLLDCSRRTALEKLTQLHEQGRIERKTVGARAVVWWLAPDESGQKADGSEDDPLFDLPTFSGPEPTDLSKTVDPHIAEAIAGERTGVDGDP